MNWLPAELPPWVPSLARAVDQRFALRRPTAPVRVTAHAQADLPPADEHPNAIAINTTTGKLVRSALNGGGTAYEWKNYDGSAL